MEGKFRQHMLRLAAAAALCLVVTSCGTERTINKVMLVHTLGYDVTGSKVKGSVLLGDYRKKGEVDATLLQTEAESEFEILPKLNAKTKSPIEIGQLGVIVFGSEFSRSHGVSTTMKNLCRDTRISTNMKLAVAEHEAFDLMKAAKSFQDAYLLSDMINQNMTHGNLPYQNLHLSLFQYYGPGRDMFLPHIVLDEKEPMVDGLALFRGDKYVTKINMNESLLIKMLTENARNGTYAVSLKLTGSKKIPLLIQVVSSKTRYDAVREPKEAISIHLSLQVRIEEIPKHTEYRSSGLISDLEKKLAVYFEDEIGKILKKCREHKVDPVGLEDQYNRKVLKAHAGTKKENPSAFQTDVTVDVNIIRTGFKQ
ncbi:Ger(x)C family spore germination protein [Paenibacillus gansuensis]|uniref:Ger(X)C family spore germination protein n=1 Tax=Paenibacillus gansuensis TaxID=306542 RepID=A0ABW5PHN6_9BACL